MFLNTCDESDYFSYILQIGLALEELQDKLMIVHRDLHPSNVLIKFIDSPIEYIDSLRKNIIFLERFIIKIIDFNWASSYHPDKPFMSHQVLSCRNKSLLLNEYGMAIDKDFDRGYYTWSIL